MESVPVSIDDAGKFGPDQILHLPDGPFSVVFRRLPRVIFSSSLRTRDGRM
jgi:hypothetical protein